MKLSKASHQQKILASPQLNFLGQAPSSESDLLLEQVKNELIKIHDLLLEEKENQYPDLHNVQNEVCSLLENDSKPLKL